MEAFLDDFARHLLGALWKVLAVGFVFALLGLAAGVAGVVVCARAGMLRRELRVWGWVAKLHYVYVPLVLMGAAGSLGCVLGAHRVTRGWIDQSAAPVVAYAQAYLPELQTSINQSVGLRRGEGVTVEQLAAREMSRKLSEERDFHPLVRRGTYYLNLAIVHYAVNQVEPPREAKEAVKAARRLDVSNIDPRAFELLPRTLKGTANSFFFAVYTDIGLVSFLLLLLGLAEYGAYRAFLWWRRRNARPAAAAAS